MLSALAKARATVARSFGEPLYSLLLIFTAVHLAFAQFIRGALPSTDILIVPPQVLQVLILGFIIAPSTVVFLLGRLTRKLGGPDALFRFHSVVMAATAALVMRQLLLYFPFLSWISEVVSETSPVAAIILGFALSAFAIWLVLRYRQTSETLFIYFAPAAVLLTLMLGNWQSVQNEVYEDYSSAIVPSPNPSAPPVFILVFDELSYEALLGEDDAVDDGRFPNFRRLADDSLTLTNATTNFINTFIVVPGLVDQVLPLADSFEIRLYLQINRVSKLYSSGCGRNYTCRDMYFLTTTNKSELTRDLAIRTAFQPFPRWFMDLSGAKGLKFFQTMNVAPPISDPRGFHVLTDDMFDLFLRDIDSYESRGRVTFLHTLLPHAPHIFDSEGSFRTFGFSWFQQDDVSVIDGGMTVWSERYLGQIGFADKLLGQFLDQLQQSGLYDDAIVIVTADHGARPMVAHGKVPVVFTSISSQIPLFIKAPSLVPQQSQIDYQHVDFGPTLYDLIGHRAPDDSRFVIDSREAHWNDVLGQGNSVFHPLKTERRKVVFAHSFGDEIYWRYELDEQSGVWKLTETIEESIPDRSRPKK